jgi:hypothetical protein
MPANTVRVARPSRWGNPFTIDAWGRDRAIALYRSMLAGGGHRVGSGHERGSSGARVPDDGDWRSKLGANAVDLARQDLRGFNLACWCKPTEACHADVLLEVANPDVADA